MNQEQVIRAKRVLSKIARANKLDLRVPLPVWDDTGTLMGVALGCDKQMGQMACRAEATFTLGPAEASDNAKIEAKAMIAVNALKETVLVSIKPKKAKAA